MSTPEARLAELGLELPEPAGALGLYRPVLAVGDLLYTSGHLPIEHGGVKRGRLGDDLQVEAGASAARLVGLAMLASVKATLGDLDRIGRLVKTVGLVQCTPEFTDQPAVINGFNELMREVFGEEAGIGARSAIGVAALPAGAPVEIEAIFQLKGASA